MNFVHDYTATDKSIIDQTHAIHYDWADLEVVEVHLSRRLVWFGLRLAPYVVLEFSQNRRLALRPRGSPITGKPDLSFIAGVLKYGLAAAPATARFAERARLWADYGALGSKEEYRYRKLGSGDLSLPELIDAAAFYRASLNFKAAERLLKFARNRDPHDLGVRKMTASLAIEKGKPSSITLALLHNVLSQDPAQPEAREARVLICLSNGMAAGEAEAKAILEERPDSRAVGFAYADYLIQKGRTEASLAVLRALQAHSYHSNTKEAAESEIHKIESSWAYRRPALNRWRRRGGRALAMVSVAFGCLVLFSVATRQMRRSDPFAPLKNSVQRKEELNFLSADNLSESNPMSSAEFSPPIFLESNATTFQSPIATALLPIRSRTQPLVGSAAEAEKRVNEALALLHKKGCSPQEFAEARNLMNAAAQAGNVGAMTYLGVMYEQSVGGPRDVALAEEWWRKSAARSDPAAQFFLGDYFLRQQNEGHLPSEVSEMDIQIWLRSAAQDRFPPAVTTLAKLKAAQDGTPIPPDELVDAPLNKSEAQPSMADRPPEVISQVRPEYPPGLRYLGIEGKIEVEFLVDASGEVKEPKTLSLSLPQFEKAAFDAVLRWRFRPGIKESRSVPMKMRVPMVFSLSD